MKPSATLACTLITATLSHGVLAQAPSTGLVHPQAGDRVQHGIGRHTVTLGQDQ